MGTSSIISNRMVLEVNGLKSVAENESSVIRQSLFGSYDGENRSARMTGYVRAITIARCGRICTPTPCDRC